MSELKAIQSYLDESLVSYWIPWCETLLAKKLDVDPRKLDLFGLDKLILFEGSDVPSRANEFYRLGLLKYPISLKGNKTKAWSELSKDNSIITNFGYVVYYIIKANTISKDNLAIKKAISAINSISALRQHVIIDSYKISLNSLMFKCIESFNSNYHNTFLLRQYLCAAILSSIKKVRYAKIILDSFLENNNISELIISTLEPDQIRDIINQSTIDKYLELTENDKLRFGNIPNQRLTNFYIGNFKRDYLRGAFNNASEYCLEFLEECYRIDNANFEIKPFDILLEEGNDPLTSLKEIFNNFHGNNQILKDTMKTLKQGIEESLKILGVSETPRLDEPSATNKIFFGPPGTGKSHAITELLKKYNIDTNHFARVTFHPDYDYSSFVGGYKPFTDEKDGGKIKYNFVPQIFTNLYVKAWSNPNENFYLIIEEINRGNCAEIFGDIFQLLDRNPEYNIEPSTELREHLQEKENDINKDEANKVTLLFDNKLQMPNNLSILASMNTSDQSLYPMDSAFKRRWDWKYVPIDTNCAESNFIIEVNEEAKYSWLEFLNAVNKSIYNVTKSEDKQIGNWFINVSDQKYKSDIYKGYILKDTFLNKVLFYLWNDIFKDEVYHSENIFVKKNDDGSKIKDVSFNDFYKDEEQNNLLIHLFEKILGLTKLHIPRKEMEYTIEDVIKAAAEPPTEG